MGLSSPNDQEARSPLVTVILSTYNWSAVLPYSIRSVLNQTFIDYELLVIGDGCTDDSAEVVKGFNDTRVRWINLAQNTGHQSGPNNEGLRQARGKFIAYLGHDDLWMPNHLSSLYEIFTNTLCDVAVSGCVYHGPPGTKLEEVTGIFDHSQAALRNFFPPSSLAHKESVINEIGGWRDPKDLQTAVDVDLLLRLASQGYQFVSTKIITVHKFAAGHRYLSYLIRSSDEQRAMLEKIEQQEMSSETCLSIIERAISKKSFMTALYQDHSQFSPGYFYYSYRRQKGLDLIELQKLEDLEYVPVDDAANPLGLDWHVPDFNNDNQTYFRWSGPSLRPKILIPFISDKPSRVALYLLDPFNLLNEVTLQLNFLPIEFSLEVNLDGWHELSFIASLKEDSFSLLELILSKSVCPMDHKLNADIRELGVIFKGYSIAPIPSMEPKLSDYHLEISNDLTPATLITQGQSFAEQRQFDIAIKHFELSLTHFPHDEWLQVHLAITHLHAGNIDLAQSQFNAIEQAFPQNLWGALGQGLVCEETHQWVKAEHIFQDLVRANPDDPNSLAGLARVLIKLGKNEVCQTLLEASPLTAQSAELSHLLAGLTEVRKSQIINRLIEQFKLTWYLEYNKPLCELAINEVQAPHKQLALIPEFQFTDHQSAVRTKQALNLSKQYSQENFLDLAQLLHRYQNIQFDLIFFDPMHIRPWVDEALQQLPTLLKPNGFLLVHDCNPKNEDLVKPFADSGNWSGQTFQAFANFHRHNPQSSFCIDEDFGIGVILNRGLVLDYALQEDLSFADFSKNRQALLGLVSYAQFEDQLKLAKLPVDLFLHREVATPPDAKETPLANPLDLAPYLERSAQILIPHRAKRSSKKSITIQNHATNQAHLNFFKNALVDKIQVIIYGNHSEDWMSALGPDSPVWQGQDLVGLVTAIDESIHHFASHLKPGYYPVVIPLMEHHIRLAPGDIASLCPNPELLDLLGNKALFAAYLLANNFTAYLPTLYESEEAVQYPCVVKSLELNGGSGIKLAWDRATLSQIIQDKQECAEPCIVQAYIAGEQEYVTHAILHDGEILWHQTFCYDLGKEPVIRTAMMTGTLKAERVLTPPAFLRVLTQIAQDLSLSGPINMDYKMVENHPYLFELNPRLGGSLMRAENVDLLSAALSVIVTETVASEQFFAGVIRQSNHFESTFYKQDQHEFMERPIDCAVHYWRFGATEGRDPGPEFSTLDYGNYYLGPPEANINPLVHYELIGQAKNFAPYSRSRRALKLTLEALLNAPKTSLS